MRRMVERRFRARRVDVGSFRSPLRPFGRRCLDHLHCSDEQSNCGRKSRTEVRAREQLSPETKRRDENGLVIQQ